MSGVHTPPQAPSRVAPTPMPPSADATTILAFFVVLQLVLPSGLVINGIPLSLSAASLVALALIPLWLCTQMTTTLGAAKGSSPVRTLLFTYLWVLLASYGRAASGFLPLDEREIGDHAMVTTFALVFVGLVVCDGVRTRDRLYFLLRVIVVCGSLVSVVGLFQYMFDYDLAPRLRPPGMHFFLLEPPASSRGGLTRASGTTANPIEFGVLCAMVLPLSIHLAFEGTQCRRRRAVWWSCALLLMSGLMFSVSRSAILGVLLAVLVLFLGWPARRRLRMALAGLGFLVLIKLVAPRLLGTFLALFENADQDSSVQWRTIDYAAAEELIAQNPWLGRGLGTWYAPKHPVFDNQYLLTLVDSGVLGLIGLLGVVFSALYAAARVGLLTHRGAASRDTATADRDLALSVAASLAVVLPTFATFDFLAFPAVSSLMFLLVGVAAALLRIVQADVHGRTPTPQPHVTP